jgi:hypothetical protein
MEFEFSRLNDAWVLVSRNIKIRDNTSGRGAKNFDGSTVCSPIVEGSCEIKRVSKGIFASGQQIDLDESVSLKNIQFATSQIISFGAQIKDKTPVILFKSQHIRACWLDGRVVRVFDSGTIDDLGTAAFQTTGALRWEKLFVPLICVVTFVLLIFQLIRRRKKPHLER